MADQTDPNYQTPVYPENYTSEQGIPPAPEGVPTTQESGPAPESIPVSETEIPVYEPPAAVPPEESPTVAVSGSSGGTPKWFYLLFGVTLIVFFIVTFLLETNYTQKKSIFQLLGIKQETLTSLPSITPLPSLTAEEILPSVTPTSPATSVSDLKLPQLSVSDEVSDLEKDVNSTDFTKLEEAISNLDREAGVVEVTP